jgi:hypothetical protein
MFNHLSLTSIISAKISLEIGAGNGGRKKRKKREKDGEREIERERRLQYHIIAAAESEPAKLS